MPWAREDDDLSGCCVGLSVVVGCGCSFELLLVSLYRC